MQTRPDDPTLLDAVAAFLLEEISPKLEADKALQFRVLIAANLASVVAGELRTGEARVASETRRLEALLPGTKGLDALNQALVKGLREGTVDRAAALAHLMATARETLEVTNPRFNLSEEV